MRRWFRRVFGEGENPLTWAVPCYSAWGVRVRAHVLFVFLVVVQLVWSALAPQGVGLGYSAVGLAVLVVLVLAHEYGHFAAVRAVGGSAEEIVLWPLGGLAHGAAPDRWGAHLWTALGGPAVNAALVLPLGAAAWGATGDRSVLVFNPFGVQSVLGSVHAGSTLATYAVVGVVWAYVLNWVLLVCNLMLPMLPLDAGRVLQALLWRSSGELRATRLAGIAGLVTAGVVLAVGVVGDQALLVGLAVFGGFVSWQAVHGARFVEETGLEMPALGDEDQEGGGKQRGDRIAEREAAERAELDQILSKISASGLDSLTRAERKTLDEATARRRAEAARER